MMNNNEITGMDSLIENIKEQKDFIEYYNYLEQMDFKDENNKMNRLSKKDFAEIVEHIVRDLVFKCSESEQNIIISLVINYLEIIRYEKIKEIKRNLEYMESCFENLKVVSNIPVRITENL